MPSNRREVPPTPSLRRKVLRSVSMVALPGIAGCSTTQAETERTDGGREPTGETPKVEDVEEFSPNPVVVLDNRIDGPASVDLTILDRDDPVFSTEVDVVAGGERTVSAFELAGGEYTVRIVRGETRAEASWTVTAPGGRTTCSPACRLVARLLPEEVDLVWVRLE